MDRRVQKTLQVLHQALIELILEKGYDAITIKDIVDKANVGRSTFYAHYDSKEKLLEGGLADLRKLLSAHQKAAFAAPEGHGKTSLAFSRALFEHANGYRDVYRAMVGKRGGAVVIGRMRALLTELVQQELGSIPMQRDIIDIPRSAVIQYVVGSLLSVLTWWVDEKTKLSPEEADAIFRRLTLPSVFPDSKL